MNTSVTQCHRCGGQAGAHFAFCFVAQLWERVMGPGFPWAPPAPPRQSELRCVHDIPLSEPCADCVPDEPDWTDDWEAEFGSIDTEPGELDGLPPRPPEPTGWPGDPPDPDGVMEDFLVIAGHVQSDAEWLPWGQTSIALAKTDLPEGYLDQRVAAVYPPKKERRYDTSGLKAAHRRQREAQEDAAVQFVYDRTDTVPGGRVRLDELHKAYVEWHQANDRPYISRDFLRTLLEEMGLESSIGRVPGERTSGRPPRLVHGIRLRTDEQEPQLPTVVVKAEPKQRDRHALIGAKPGPELPKQVRELIEPLVTEQGWAYEPCNSNGRGKPRLTKGSVTVTLPTTPHLRGRTLENTRSFLKQNGALL